MNRQDKPNRKTMRTTRQFLIEEKRRQVATLVMQSMTEIEIAKKLGVDDTIISKDVKILHTTRNNVWRL